MHRRNSEGVLRQPVATAAMTRYGMARGARLGIAALAMEEVAVEFSVWWMTLARSR